MPSRSEVKPWANSVVTSHFFRSVPPAGAVLLFDEGIVQFSASNALSYLCTFFPCVLSWPAEIPNQSDYPLMLFHLLFCLIIPRK